MGQWRGIVAVLWLSMQVGCGTDEANPVRPAPPPPLFPVAVKSAPAAVGTLRASVDGPAAPPVLGGARGSRREQDEARAARRCTLELRARARPLRSGGFQIDVSLHNLAGTAVQLSYPDRCPLGPVSISGLGASYDYYHGCNKGACVGPRPALHTALAAGASENLVSLEIDPRGGSCRPKLAPGSRLLVASLPDATPAVCSSAPLGIRIASDQAEVSSSPAPSGDLYRCERPDDCVLSCPEARGCCGHPCGCSHAIHRDQRAAYEASYARTCQKQPCPAVACAYRPAATATCRNGRCEAVSDHAF